MKKVVVFDFDGVLCNSTEECMITGYNAWMRYNSKTGFIRTAAEVPFDVAAYFRPRRSLVRTGGQYFVIFNSAAGGGIDTEKDFDDACRKYSAEIVSYEKLFFQCRNILRDEGLSSWLDLLVPYDHVLEHMKEIMSRSGVYIVTGKDRDSVRAFLGHHGIDMGDERIYDTHAAHNKAEALKMIARDEHEPLSGLIFLDDNVTHLLKPKEAGCRVYMAGWGYHLPEHLQQAMHHRIEILDLKDWYLRISNEISEERKGAQV